jgi:hypothetical protein
VRRRVLRVALMAGAVLALTGSASEAEPAAPKVYPGAEDVHAGCGDMWSTPTVTPTADAR